MKLVIGFLVAVILIFTAIAYVRARDDDRLAAARFAALNKRVKALSRTVSDFRGDVIKDFSGTDAGIATAANRTMEVLNDAIRKQAMLIEGSVGRNKRASVVLGRLLSSETKSLEKVMQTFDLENKAEILRVLKDLQGRHVELVRYLSGGDMDRAVQNLLLRLSKDPDALSRDPRENFSSQDIDDSLQQYGVQLSPAELDKLGLDLKADVASGVNLKSALYMRLAQIEPVMKVVEDRARYQQVATDQANTDAFDALVRSNEAHREAIKMSLSEQHALTSQMGVGAADMVNATASAYRGPTESLLADQRNSLNVEVLRSLEKVQSMSDALAQVDAMDASTKQQLEARARLVAQIKADAEAAQRKAQQEAEAKLLAEQAAALKAKQDEENRVREAQERARAEAEAQTRALEARVRAEAEIRERARLKAIADEQARQKAIADEQARQKAIADEQARQKAISDEQARQKAIADEQARQKAIADEQARQKAIAELARQKAIADEQARQKAIAEEQARQKVIAEEQARQRVIAEEAARQKAISEEQARQRAIAEEAARKKAAAEGIMKALEASFEGANATLYTEVGSEFNIQLLVRSDVATTAMNLPAGWTLNGSNGYLYGQAPAQPARFDFFAFNRSGAGKMYRMEVLVPVPGTITRTVAPVPVPSGIQFRLDASVLAQGVISNIPELSGRDLTMRSLPKEYWGKLTHTYAVVRPAINGNMALDFTNRGFMRSPPTMKNYNEFTIFVVAQRNPVGTHFWLDYVDPQREWNIVQFGHMDQIPTVKIVDDRRDNGVVPYRNYRRTSKWAGDLSQEPHVYTFRVSGDDMLLQNLRISDGWSNGDRGNIGHLNEGTPNRFGFKQFSNLSVIIGAGGIIGEIIYYDRALNDDEYGRMMNHLRQKWAGR